MKPSIQLPPHFPLNLATWASRVVFLEKVRPQNWHRPPLTRSWTSRTWRISEYLPIAPAPWNTFLQIWHWGSATGSPDPPGPVLGAARNLMICGGRRKRLTFIYTLWYLVLCHGPFYHTKLVKSKDCARINSINIISTGTIYRQF